MTIPFFLIPLLFITASILFNWYRSQQSLRFSLTPNCLLTKHPITFVDGQKSIFHFKKYWNNVPLFLKEHGYQIDNPLLPWRNSKKRNSTLLLYLNNLQSIGKKTHLFIDDSQYNEWQPLLISPPSSVASITIISAHKTTASRLFTTRHQNQSNIHILFLSPLNISHFLWSQLFLKIHNWIISLTNKNTPSLGTNFALPNQNNELHNLKKILQHSVQLAEKDFQESIKIYTTQNNFTENSKLIFHEAT